MNWTEIPVVEIVGVGRHASGVVKRSEKKAGSSTCRRIRSGGARNDKVLVQKQVPHPRFAQVRNDKN
jgi:hypothetical protein